MKRISLSGEYTAPRSAQGYLCEGVNLSSTSGPCGSACGSEDGDSKPETKPTSCGSACSAGDK